MENGDLSDYMTYEGYIEFRNSIMDFAVYQTTALESLVPVITQQQIDQMVDFVDGLWEQGELQDHLTYEEYLEFRESIKLSAEQGF